MSRYIARDVLVRARNRFGRHRYGAKRRGIPVLLTFERWWDLWWSSGHWFERGPAQGQYCMARFGDQGAYEVNNVRICTTDENRAEFVHTPEHRAKVSAALTGYKHTPEMRAKVSAANRLRKSEKRSKYTSRTGLVRQITPEHRAKISAALTGRRISAEHRANMSAALKGRRGQPHSPETRAKIAAANKGRILSAEHLAKLIAVNKGQKRSPEICAKMRAAWTDARRAKQAERCAQMHATPWTKERHAKLSASAFRRWANPEYRAKQSARISTAVSRYWAGQAVAL